MSKCGTVSTNFHIKHDEQLILSVSLYLDNKLSEYKDSEYKPFVMSPLQQHYRRLKIRGLNILFSGYARCSIVGVMNHFDAVPLQYCIRGGIQPKRELFSSRCAVAVSAFSPGAWRTSEVGVAR